MNNTTVGFGSLLCFEAGGREDACSLYAILALFSVLIPLWKI